MADNAEYGLAIAIWDPGDDEIRLGLSEYTKGGMQFRYSEEFWGPTYDVSGNTPVDQVKVGETAEADVFMGEMVLQKFADIFPSAELITDGVDETMKKIEWGGLIGKSLLDYAEKLTFRPLDALDEDMPENDDKSRDFTLLHAIPRADFDVAFQLEQERVYQVTFVGVMDKTLQKTWVYGDMDADPDSA